MADNTIKFADKKGLELYTKLRNHKKQIQIGEKVYLKDIPLVWDGEQWCEYNAPKVEMSLYDINEQIIRQLPDYTKEDEDAAKIEIDNWSGADQGGYYMLLCKEQSYYTVFKYTSPYNEGLVVFQTLGDAVIACVKDVGTIKSVSKQEDNTYEIWVLDSNDVMWCLHLFNYDNGIVEFGCPWRGEEDE